MRRQIAISIVLLVAAQAHAQVPGLSNAQVVDRTSVNSPAGIKPEGQASWLAFSIPVLPNTTSPCCWSGHWDSDQKAGCSLKKLHNNYGTRSDSPLTDSVVVYSKHDGTMVEELLMTGQSCPVDGEKQSVQWLGETGEKETLDWLQNVATSKNEKADGALYALALHESLAATAVLHELARARNNHKSEQAIFWLGEHRGNEGFEALKSLLEELPHGPLRRHINFSLSQSDVDAAEDLLFELAESDADPGQRSDALFWIAERFPVRAETLLLEILQKNEAEEMTEQAVFAISQLPTERSGKILLELARSPEQSRRVRKQALFWLVQSDNDSDIEALTELLVR